MEAALPKGVKRLEMSRETAGGPHRPSRRAISEDREPRADDVVRWIEKLYVPEGVKLGERFELAEFQVEILRAIYDNPHHTRRAILSMGRKNAKTTLCALIVLVHLCGPKAQPNSQLYSTAQSRDQAAVLFHLAAKIVRMSPELREYITIRDTAKELVCAKLGSKYRALSADASTAFGLSPTLCIHDELGQVRGPRSPLYEALETATGAQENPLSIIISTQAPTDADLLSVLIDDALAEHDPRTVLKLYTAPAELDPFDEATINTKPLSS
jgi:phage terminase large subunit-like protein